MRAMRGLSAGTCYFRTGFLGLGAVGIVTMVSLAAFGAATLPAAESASFVAEDESISPTLPHNEYRLGAGDVIEISVFGVPDYKHARRVSESGVINLPLVGMLEVLGKTSAETKTDLEQRLSAGLIKDPEVQVDVLEYRSRTSFVLGHVQRPGQYQLTRPTRLVDMIAMAGGLTSEAGDEAIVHCSGDDTAALESRLGLKSLDERTPGVTKISLKSLLDGGDQSANLPIDGGCVVQIPERDPDMYYVVGDVVIPGTFEIDRNNPMRLTRALARAGGPNKTAKKKKLVLVRDPDGPNREEIPINFAAIVKGEIPDLQIRKNDVIFVPGHGFKSLGYGLIGAIPVTVSRGAVR